ncbi:MAG TPA: electron transfer flavoprotein-ubiquinone oxidoreductase [Gammaproteobacteria bacterium]|jgi:electron-transferring-flavoprotein dehydrogenase|nr:electron transfer flavoprotein-ubiquinone oxidoreductase [Gammaproteobacteria bacterium]
MTEEKMDFDVVIVGGGPAGLAASIRLADLSQQTLSICVIDKGEAIGSHILSGAVLDPQALNELLPHWQKENPPYHTPVTQDEFSFLTKHHKWRLPTPPQMKNMGHFIISLGQFCRFLAKEAEKRGVNIFSGFAATDILYEEDRVSGILIGDKGRDRFEKPKSSYQPGIALYAKQVIFAEGCRGSLTEKLFQRYGLRKACDPQTYALGIKELWEIPHSLHTSGKVVHTIGWPLNHRTYGGSFIYHFGENLLSIGLVVGLDYENPYLNIYEEFQRLKTHPAIYPLLAQSKRIAYGARTLIEGGMQSLPALSFPGGVIIGDAAGFLNVPKIKGIHYAMKSGMIAAESLYEDNLLSGKAAECTAYTINIKKSWIWKDLYRARNIRPAFHFAGLIPGILYAAIDTYLFRGNAPWTFHNHIPDHAMLKPASRSKMIAYPKHDGRVSFDLASSLYLANIRYEENQPYHLKLKNRHEIPISVNLHIYASPETRYCPAGVYEIRYHDKNEPRLQINGGNCIHCKACDIKDPTQNIVWTPSEGGSGPSYEEM